MKLFIFLLFMISHAFAAGGCLRDPAVNAAVADEANIPCEKFPEFLEVDEIDIDVEGDITFYEEDFRRLPKLTELSLSGDEPGAFTLKLKGTISLPKLDELQIQEGLRRIDTSEGRFVFRILDDLETIYFADLLRLLKSGELSPDASIEIVASEEDQVQFDLSGVNLKGYLSFYSFRSVRNLRVNNLSGLWIHGSEKYPTLLSGISASIEQSLDLEHVRFEDFTPFRLPNCYRLNLTNVSVDVPFVTPDSMLSYVGLTNSSITLPGDEVLKNTTSFNLKNSQLSGAVIRVENKEMRYFSLDNSEATLDRLPYAPGSSQIMVSGKVTILDPAKPLIIGHYNGTVFLSSLRLPVLNIVLRNPKSLTNLILIDNVAESIQLENTEYLGLIPKNIKILVDKKSTALEWRKLFKTKAVGFTESSK